MENKDLGISKERIVELLKEGCIESPELSEAIYKMITENNKKLSESLNTIDGGIF